MKQTLQQFSRKAREKYRAELPISFNILLSSLSPLSFLSAELNNASSVITWNGTIRVCDIDNGHSWSLHVAKSSPALTVQQSNNLLRASIISQASYLSKQLAGSAAKPRHMLRKQLDGLLRSAETGLGSSGGLWSQPSPIKLSGLEPGSRAFISFRKWEGAWIKHTAPTRFYTRRIGTVLEQHSHKWNSERTSRTKYGCFCCSYSCIPWLKGTYTGTAVKSSRDVFFFSEKHLAAALIIK